MSIKVEVEERLTLCGFAYFEEPRGKGRVHWSCEPTGNGSQHALAISASHGLPSDAALEAIKKALIKFVQTKRKAPAMTILEGKTNHEQEEADGPERRSRRQGIRRGRRDPGQRG